MYDELRRLARARMADEAPGLTLQATSLVHEAYLRIAAEGEPVWRDRRHFFGAAARAMRHWALATAMVRVGRTLVEQGLLAEAGPLLLAAHRSLELQFGAESSDALAAGDLLAELYARWGRTEDARAYARRAAPAAR